MERARSDMLRAVEIDQAAELRATGAAYPWWRRTSLPPARRLGDDLLLVSTVGQVRASAVDIHQRVMRETELLVEGRITAAFLDAPAARSVTRRTGW